MRLRTRKQSNIVQELQSAKSYYSRDAIRDPEPMHRQEICSPPTTDIDYICVATDLLSKMMSELQSLELNNRRLTLTMASAGHDLRQRLHILLGTVELLTSTEDEVRCAELGQRAKSLIFRLAGELEQLAFQAERDGRRAGSSAHCFAISKLLGDIKNDWESEAAAKCLRFSVDQADCVVESDERLLAVIMNNVVGNAVKHTALGGVTVASAIEGPSLIVAVSDTGPGISDEDLRRSFSLSSRMGGLNEGMGLGLSIARKTAEILGHEFEVSTGMHGGTCVRLHVPVAAHRKYDSPRERDFRDTNVQ
jgi:two-component system, sensor histidine kinase